MIGTYVDQRHLYEKNGYISNHLILQYVYCNMYITHTYYKRNFARNKRIEMLKPKKEYLYFCISHVLLTLSHKMQTKILVI